MAQSKFFKGSSILLGNNTVPGVKAPKKEAELIPVILKACTDFGLDYYPTVVEYLTYDEISEIAAYGGFPVRYPHWRWGMSYEELQKGYELGMHRIYEMVINSNPCYIYILSSNTLVDNITVIAHATGHNDFFKNNIRFQPTRQKEGEAPLNVINTLANHGTRIRNYVSRWGKERVTEFLDHVIRLDTLVDPAQAWTQAKINAPEIKDARRYREPKRLNVNADYMEDWINTKEWRGDQNKKVKEKEAADEIDLFIKPTRNILGYLRDNAPLKPWQTDIVDMLYEEALYFSPQRNTKMLNEGWASYVDYKMMAEGGMASLGQEPGAGIIHYAIHKAGVLGGKYSMNPYKLGYTLLMDVEERWNKGRFGQEWLDCNDMKKREDWDTKVGLGKEKVFEVRKYYDDVTAIQTFFTEEFCEKNEFFEWVQKPNGDMVIANRDYKKIRKNLIAKHLNGGLPDIELVDPNHKGKRHFLLQHVWDGRPLYEPYIREILSSIYKLWKERVILATKNRDGEELVCVATGPDPDKDVAWFTRKEYDKES